MESILSTQSDILKIVGEQPTPVIVKVEELDPRREVILLLLNSTVCVCVSLLLHVSPVSGFFSTF